MEARITTSNGVNATMAQVDELRTSWEAVLPKLFEDFVKEQGLNVASMQWLSARPGSVIAKFSMVLATADGITEERMDRTGEEFVRFVSDMTPEYWSEKIQPLEISGMVIVVPMIVC